MILGKLRVSSKLESGRDKKGGPYVVSVEVMSRHRDGFSMAGFRVTKEIFDKIAIGDTLIVSLGKGERRK